jgi:hypothetical protein
MRLFIVLSAVVIFTVGCSGRQEVGELVAPVSADSLSGGSDNRVQGLVVPDSSGLAAPSGGPPMDTIARDRLQYVKFLDWDDVVERTDFIRLQTTSSCLIGEISRITLTDSLIFVFDAQGQKVFLFDRKGAYVRTIGRQGKGPGEYVRFQTGYVDRKARQVVLFDPGAGKVHTYRYNGSHVATVKPDYLMLMSSCTLLDDGNVLCDWMLFDDRSRHAYYVLDGKTFAILSTHLEHNLNTNRYMSPFARHPISNSGEVLLLAPFSDVIYQFADNKVVPRYFVETDMRVRDVRAYVREVPNDLMSIQNKLCEENSFAGFDLLMETRQYLLLYHYRHRGRLLWDKVHKSGVSFVATIKGPGRMRETIFTSMIGATENVFIGQWTASEVVLFRENVGTSGLAPTLKQIVTQTKEDDNPVIVLYHMKDRIGVLPVESGK